MSRSRQVSPIVEMIRRGTFPKTYSPETKARYLRDRAEAIRRGTSIHEVRTGIQLTPEEIAEYSARPHIGGTDLY